MMRQYFSTCDRCGKRLDPKAGVPFISEARDKAEFILNSILYVDTNTSNRSAVQLPVLRGAELCYDCLQIAKMAIIAFTDVWNVRK